MPVLVRPYPVALLAEARVALTEAQDGNFKPLQALFVSARDALKELDPDEVKEFVSGHSEAKHEDKPALRAALDLADTWEGVVAIGATIEKTSRFRGFILTCAALRYLDVPDPDLPQFRNFCRGDWLPQLGPEDSVLYAALPMLIGLGPELADELDAEVAFDGPPVWSVLRLPEETWDGADPLDGMAITAEDCSAAYPGAPTAWRSVLARGARSGLIIRPA